MAVLSMHTPFHKQLRWKIESGIESTEKWHFTPAMAEEILRTWNTQNRPVSMGDVEKLAAEMKAGRWRYTGEAIIFSKHRLIDGQHRLHACLKSGAGFDANITFGAPDEAFAYIDIGRKRTAADIFSINGVQNAALISAALQVVLAYDNGRMRGNTRVDSATLHAEYLKHLEIQKSIKIGHAFAKSRVAPPAIMVALHYIAARKSREAADAFFTKLADGIGFAGKKDPAYMLRNRLINSMTAAEKLGRIQVAALTVKAWNAHRLGVPVGVLKFTADETFPRVA